MHLRPEKGQARVGHSGGMVEPGTEVSVYDTDQGIQRRGTECVPQ